MQSKEVLDRDSIKEVEAGTFKSPVGADVSCGWRTDKYADWSDQPHTWVMSDMGYSNKC